MNAQTILSHGIQYVKNGDTTFSHTGEADFKEKNPEVIKLTSGVTNSRPRTKASQNNSYT